MKEKQENLPYALWHWLGWAVLPVALIFYSWFFWEWHHRSGWQEQSVEGKTAVWGIVLTVFFMVKSAVWRWVGTRRFATSRPLLELLLAAFAIGSAGLAMIVPLFIIFCGDWSPWIGIFVASGLSGSIVCCPALRRLFRNHQ